MKGCLHQLSHLNEIQLRAAWTQLIIQWRRKGWNEQHIEPKHLKEGMLVLVCNEKLGPIKKSFKLGWNGPYRLHKIFTNNTVQFEDLSGKVMTKIYNGSKVKFYRAPISTSEHNLEAEQSLKEEILEEPIVSYIELEWFQNNSFMIPCKGVQVDSLVLRHDVSTVSYIRWHDLLPRGT